MKCSHNVIIFDAEIIKAIPPKNDEDRIPGIEYCEGWRDFSNMGVSVIGAYDYLTDRYRVFCQDNFYEFADRISDPDCVVVSFNGHQFDKPLLDASGLPAMAGLEEFELAYHYDILRELWKSLGHDPDVFTQETHSGCGLEACCQANFGLKKTGSGASAPIDWQRGRIGKVIDYCLNDVRLTKRLFDRIMGEGFLINPQNTNEIINMPSLTSLFLRT